MEVSHPLDAYVPPYVRWRLAADPASSLGPFEDVYQAAVIHADISGFTSLAEGLAALGVAGAEHVCDTLRLFFQELGEIVALNGGHTLSFAGDAATAIWPVTEPRMLPTAALMAVRCAMAINRRLSGRPLRGGLSQLDIHASVGAGEVRTASVGGVEGRWLPMVFGEAVHQVLETQHQAQSGEVVVSREAWPLIRAHVLGQPVADGTVRVRRAPITALEPSLAILQQATATDAVIRAYVPGSVQARLAERAVEWLAEFRHATVAFIFLRNREGLAAGLDSVQGMVRPVHQIVRSTGGSVNKVLADPDGFAVVAAWGLPQHAHEDNAVRAVRAATAVEACIRGLGSVATIGIASGRLYMGQAGTDDHKEYALIGDVVNVAARLAHETPAGIRCDATTRLDARSRHAFEALPALSVRGRTQPVAIYRPVAEKLPGGRDPLIGRDAERRRLRRMLDDVEAGGSARVVVIEGEAGIGKSRLAADLIAETQHRPVQCLAGCGEAMEAATPYHAWRDIFARLLRLDTVADRASQSQRVHDSLETRERQARISLTNVVLPFDFPETPETLALKPAARARATRELLGYLFGRLTPGFTIVLVLEDAHWMDSASWALAHELSTVNARLLIVIVARPVVTEQMSPDWRALRNAPGTERIRLEGLAPADALALARHRLDVDSLPPEVAEQIVTIAEGHPFFTEQLVLAMRDKDRVIRIESGECHVAATFSTARFAETVQALVDSRIDGLSLQQQDTLKVAAVLGRRFDVASFRNVHPGKPETDDLQKQLDTLTDLELLRVTDGPSGRTYSFKHSITQEAVSGWLLPSERRNLNFRVAQMIEDQHPADLTPVHALLAHHWREAGVISKALDYLELAALRALQEDANLEAIQFMQQALEYERTAGGVESSIATRLATWKQHLAEATWVMGDTQRAKHYVADALAQLHRAPRRPAIELAIQLLQRLAQAVLPAALFVERDDTRRQRLVQTSRIAAISAVLNTDPLDHVGALANGLLSYNLGARAGTTDVYALSMVAYAAGMLKLGPVARSYFARMRREAQAQNELRPLLFGLLLESMHRFSNGEIKASLKCLTDGLDLAGSGGNQRDRARLLILLGATMCFSDRMEPGLRAVREAYELARYERMAALERSWSLITLGGAYAQHSPTDELAEKYGSLREKIRESLTRDSQSEGLEGSRVRIATAVALDALVYSRLDRLDEALAAACEALDFLRSFRNLLPVHPTTWLLVQGPFEALWRAWERARTDPEAARRIAPHAQSFARVLARFSVLHPVYKPRALLFRGLVELRTGHAARAKSTWTRASAVAESLAAAQHDEDDACFMFDRALTLMALGGGALNGTIDRPAMVRALALLSCCGIPFFERRVQACLDGEAEGCELI